MQVSSFVGGGYIAGQMRRRIGDGTSHEVEMHDGSHGLVDWAVSVVIGLVLASWIAMAGLANVVGKSGSMDYHVDRLLRSEASPPVAGHSVDTLQITRVLARAVNSKTIDVADTAYLVRELATRPGLPEAEEQQRFE